MDTLPCLLTRPATTCPACYNGKYPAPACPACSPALPTHGSESSRRVDNVEQSRVTLAQSMPAASQAVITSRGASPAAHARRRAGRRARQAGTQGSRGKGGMGTRSLSRPRQSHRTKMNTINFCRTGVQGEGFLARRLAPFCRLYATQGMR